MARVVSTGIPALDKALMSGVPKGSTLLITGTPGAGMELFAKQFASAGGRDENIVYFTTAERDEDIKSTMEDFGWKADLRIVNIGRMYYDNVLARKLEVSRHRQEGLTLQDLRRIQEEEWRPIREVNFLTSLTYEVSKLSPPFRAIVDSLDFFFEYYPHNEVLSALRTIKAHTQHEEGVTLMTLLGHVYETRTQSGVEEIVDFVFELERERAEDSISRYLIIKKVRNHPEKTGIYSYEVTKEGIAAK